MVTTLREPLVRHPGERVLLGVCAAVGNHLGISPWYVRALTLFVPLLIPIYVFLAVAVPKETMGEVVQTRLARVQKSMRLAWLNRLEQPLLIIGLAIGIWLAGGLHGSPTAGSVAAGLLIAFGLAALWSRPASQSIADALGRIAIGTIAVVVGASLAAIRVVGVYPLFAGFVLIILTFAVIVVGPALYRILNDLTDERLRRERETQRADIAAHLHDSVLQTLGVIRARSDDSAEVSRLARAQERELRRWLYEDRPEPGESLSDEIDLTTGRIEDTHGGVIEVVVAGDTRPGAWSEPLVAALGEACTNSIRHGGGEASVYVEISDRRVEAWVRDRGEGFDLDDVAPDRVGVRESILHRMKRAGGGAEVRSPLPDGGTEVYLWQNNA